MSKLSATPLDPLLNLIRPVHIRVIFKNSRGYSLNGIELFLFFEKSVGESATLALQFFMVTRTKLSISVVGAYVMDQI